MWHDFSKGREHCQLTKVKIVGEWFKRILDHVSNISAYQIVVSAITYQKKSFCSMTEAIQTMKKQDYSKYILGKEISQSEEKDLFLMKKHLWVDLVDEWNCH